MLRFRRAHLGLVLLLLAAGCSEGGLPTETAHPGDPLFAVFDGSNDGIEGFYFLPPMIKNPDYGGTFDPTLSPVVEICETPACLELHQTFTMTEGAGSELVRLDEENEHYVVNWHTDRTGPDGTGTEVGQTYRIRVQVAGTVLGYADVQMAENGKEAKNTSTDDVIGLVDGRTLPIRFRVEEGTVLVVGSDGGTFTSSDGAVTIQVPQGAVEGDIGIIVTPVTDNLDDPDVVPGLAFEFLPSPYTFAEPVILTVVYDPSGLPTGIPEDELRLLAFDGAEWVQLPGSSVDVPTSTVSGPLDSFSRKAVGRGKVHAIAVTPEDASIGVDETQQFVATVTNVDGEVMSRNVQWSSSDDAVATVDNIGVAMGMAFGETTIEARSGKISGNTVLTVENPSLEIVMEKIAAGETHSCGLTASGDAYCWGEGASGRLGIGTTPFAVWEPTMVVMPPGVSFASISAGRNFTLALTSTGDVFTWGAGQTTPVPIDMPAGVAFVAISAGDFHRAALSSTGAVYTWGSNSNGQLGDGTTQANNTPTAVDLPPGVRVASISAGGGHTLALTTTGEAYAWGHNNWGQLGNASKTDSATPVSVHLPEGIIFTAISAGKFHNLALATTGEAYSWGHNGPGKLGSIPISSTGMLAVPTVVNMPVGISFASVSAGYWVSMAVSTTGAAYSWGSNSWGELGYDPEIPSSNIPTAVMMPTGVSFVSVDSGWNHTVAISTTGNGYGWGRAANGRLAVGGTSIYTPQQMRGDIIFAH